MNETKSLDDATAQATLNYSTTHNANHLNANPVDFFLLLFFSINNR